MRQFSIRDTDLRLAHQDWHKDSSRPFFEDDRENDATGHIQHHDGHPHPPAHSWLVTASTATFLTCSTHDGAQLSEEGMCAATDGHPHTPAHS